MTDMLDRWHGPIAVARRLAAKILAGEKVDSPTLGEPLCISDLADAVQQMRDGIADRDAMLNGAQAANATLRAQVATLQEQMATQTATVRALRQERDDVRAALDNALVGFTGRYATDAD